MKVKDSIKVYRLSGKRINIESVLQCLAQPCLHLGNAFENAAGVDPFCLCKTKSDVTSWLKTFQWFSALIKVKANSLK